MLQGAQTIEESKLSLFFACESQAVIVYVCLTGVRILAGPNLISYTQCQHCSSLYNVAFESAPFIEVVGCLQPDIIVIPIYWNLAFPHLEIQAI